VTRLKISYRKLIAIMVLVALLSYSIYIISISFKLIINTYLLGKKFKIDVSEVYLKNVNNKTNIFINYSLNNPIKIKLRIVRIQVVIYSDGKYIWTHTEDLSSIYYVIEEKRVFKILSFPIPKSKLDFMAGKITFKTYVLCEVLEPIARRFILQFISQCRIKLK